MKRLGHRRERFDRTDVRMTRRMARYGVVLPRISLGLVFLWFGVLKFVPSRSPAEDLAATTVNRLSLPRQWSAQKKRILHECFGRAPKF